MDIGGKFIRVTDFEFEILFNNPEIQKKTSPPMSNIPDDLKYTREHEWLRLADDGTAMIGITDFAQESLGDITFVELPEIGSSLSKSEVFGVVESVKAASDLYLPVGGEILAVNGELDEAPELVNSDPYYKGWLIKVKLADSAETESLLAAADYEKII